ncbi:MAG: PAS domain-containing protein [Chloroflexota bacterium]
MPKINPWLLDMLKRLAEGIVAVAGPPCEVVIHDFGDLEHSVVAIAGNVTGRQPGAPVPDLSFTSDELDCNIADQLNYHSRFGPRNLQSSTIWIRDPEGRPIGAVCINMDYSELLQVRELIDKLTAPPRDSSEFVVSDTFAKDVDELIELSVANFLHEERLAGVATLRQEDKLRLIHTLERRGLFQIRGAVNRVADLLNVSRASIYNYRSSQKNNEISA